jgi:tetratricopeptide (TPR) repeat protein
MTSVTRDAFVGLGLARRAKTWAEQLGNPELTINAYRILGLMAYNSGAFDAAKTAYEAALGLIDAHGAAFYESRVLNCYASLLVETGDYDKAEGLLERVERSSAGNLAESWATAVANQAQLALQTRDYPRCAEKADIAFTAPGLSTWTRLETLGYRGLARLEMGQLEGAYADAA